MSFLADLPNISRCPLRSWTWVFSPLIWLYLRLWYNRARAGCDLAIHIFLYTSSNRPAENLSGIPSWGSRIWFWVFYLFPQRLIGVTASRGRNCPKNSFIFSSKICGFQSRMMGIMTLMLVSQIPLIFVEKKVGGGREGLCPGLRGYFISIFILFWVVGNGLVGFFKWVTLA